MVAETKLAPALESGDQLSREGFHRRYSVRKELKKAELVAGVVYLPSPVRHPQHGRPSGQVAFFLGGYVAGHPEIKFGTDATIKLDSRNEVQPDAHLFRAVPGGPVVDADGYIDGAPQLVIGVTASLLSVPRVVFRSRNLCKALSALASAYFPSPRAYMPVGSLRSSYSILSPWGSGGR